MADIKTKTTVLSVDVNDAIRRTGDYKTKIDELRRSLQGLKEDSEEYNRVARELNETIAGLNASLNASSSGNMDKLGRSLQNVSAQVNDTTKTIQNSNLAGRIAELRQQMNEAGEFSSVREYKEYLDLLKASLLNLDESSEEYTATANELRDAQDRLNRVMQASKGYADAADGSYNQLVRTMSDLKRQWRATADEEERAQIGRKILDINNQLKEMDASIGNYQRNVGDYQNAFEEAFKVVLRGIGANSSALGHLSSEIIQMIPMIKKTVQVATTGLKGIKAALASTGIGALVVGLGLVISHWKDIAAWAEKTVPRFKRVNEAIEKNKKSMEDYKAAVKETEDSLRDQNELLAAMGENKLDILEGNREDTLGKIREVSDAIWNLKNHMEIFKDSVGVSKKEKDAWAERLAMYQEHFNKLNEQLRDLNHKIEVERESQKTAAKNAAQDIAESARFAVLTPAQQLTETYKKQKAELEKWGIDTTNLTKKYYKDLAALSKKADKITINPLKIEKATDAYDKLREETLEYLEWFENEYAKTDEEVFKYRQKKAAEAIDVAKESDKKAAQDAKDTYMENLDERLAKGEITKAQYDEAAKQAEEELQKAITEIDAQYADLRADYEAKTEKEAIVKMNELHYKEAQKLFNQINDGWSKTYEKQIYDAQRLNDALLKLDLDSFPRALDEALLTLAKIDKYTRNGKNNFTLFSTKWLKDENGNDIEEVLDEKLNEIVIKGNVTKEKLAEQVADYYRSIGKLAEGEIVGLRTISENSWEVEVRATGEILGKITNAWSESSDGILRNIYEQEEAASILTQALEDYYKLLNTPPKHISNYFDDDEAIAYYDKLIEEENKIFSNRRSNLYEIWGGLLKQREQMTEGSEEYIQTEQMIADTEMELSDVETEHILNNLDLIDEKEEKLKDNREKRWEWWMDNMAGVSSTLDNLGNIFQNELKREVEAGKISEEVAKDRFESLKALNYASVVMDTASAIMKVWKTSSDMPQPFGSIWGGIQTAALATQGILQLQQIKQQQFSASSSSTPGVTATPTQADYEPQYTANMTSNSELTELTNALNKRKLYVSVTDIEDTEKMVQARDSESTY